VPAGPARAGVARRVVKGLTSWLKGALITLAVIYVVTGLVLTFGVASVNALFWRPGSFSDMVQRTMVADAARPYGLVPDPRITPEEAGRAFAALQPGGRRGGKFTFKAIADRPGVPWRTWKLDPTLFKDPRGANWNSSWNGPSAQQIIPMVRRGLSAKEREVLRAVATAPVWRDYDLFARAPAADLVGGQFTLPFASDATIFEMPFVRFAATKELAYASVSRAAWHLSQGRPDSAEMVLRATVTFGRVLSDNATMVIEQLIGNVITGIGREGLVQLYAATGDPRGAAIASIAGKAAVAAVPNAVPPLAIRALGGGDLAADRARLLAIATSPKIDRALRYEALRSLAVSSCTNVRELLTGPNAGVRAAFDQARRDLARYPGEVALIDLIAESLQRPEALVGGLGGELTPSRVLVLAGKAYFNPRLASCGVMITSRGRF